MTRTSKKPGPQNPVLDTLMVSLAPNNQPIAHPSVLPGCNLLVDNGAGYLGLMPLAIGSTVSWQFSLPSWLDPVTFRFQDWLLDGALFESTERLDVPVTK